MHAQTPFADQNNGRRMATQGGAFRKKAMTAGNGNPPAQTQKTLLIRSINEPGSGVFRVL
jgi:hypothetical protein